MSFSSKKYRLTFAMICFAFLAPAQAQEMDAVPVAQDQKQTHATEILQEQLKILSDQGLVGKGKGVKRRYEKLRGLARSSYRNGAYDWAALYFYNIYENPEFSAYINRKDIEKNLILSLFFAGIDNVAMDYAGDVFQRGPKDKNFRKAFSVLAEISNKKKDWEKFTASYEKLRKKHPVLPQRVLEEANYVMGRKFLFEGNFEKAKNYFDAVSSRSRYHRRAKYHLGVLAVHDGDLIRSEKLFWILANTPGRAGHYLSPTPAEDLKRFQDLCLLSLSRVRYSMNRAAPFEIIPYDSEYYPVAQIELGWANYKKRNFEVAQDLALQFQSRFPGHFLIPRTAILNGHALLEDGNLYQAQIVFREAIATYVGVAEKLQLIADRDDPEDFIEGLLNLETDGTPPEIVGLLSRDGAIRKADGILNEISVQRDKLNANKGAWQEIRKAISSGDKKVAFAAPSRIQPFGGRAKSDAKISTDFQFGKEFSEIENLEEEIRERQKEIDRALASTELSRGRRRPLVQAIRKEKKRLDEIESRAVEIRNRIGQLNPKSLEVALEKEKDYGGVKEFDQLIAKEIELLPAINDNIASGISRVQDLGVRLRRERIREVAEELHQVVRAGFRG